MCVSVCEKERGTARGREKLWYRKSEKEGECVWEREIEGERDHHHFLPLEGSCKGDERKYQSIKNEKFKKWYFRKMYRKFNFNLFFFSKRSFSHLAYSCVFKDNLYFCTKWLKSVRIRKYFVCFCEFYLLSFV